MTGVNRKATERDRQIAFFLVMSLDSSIEPGRRLWARWMLGEMIVAPLVDARRLIRITGVGT